MPGRYDAWDKPTAPRIRSITTSEGCGNVVQSSNVTLSGCQGGELLQLYGTQFMSAPWVMAILGVTNDDYYIVNQGYLGACEQLTVVSDTYATCVLPHVQDYAKLQYDTPYMMLLYNATVATVATRGLRSNALFLTFASNGSAVVTSPSPSSSSSSRNLALLVALPVVLGVLGLLLVAVMVRQLRSKARSARHAFGSDTEGAYSEEKQAERGSGGKWWQSKTEAGLAGQGEVRGVELSEA